MELSEVIADFADALVEVDRSRACHKQFQAGVGPFGEADTIRAALPELRKKNIDRYEKAVIKGYQIFSFPVRGLLS